MAFLLERATSSSQRNLSLFDSGRDGRNNIMAKVVIKFENGIYRLYDDGKYVGVVEKKNYPKDRDPSGYIWKLPANSLGRQWLTYKKLEGVLEYELTDAHVDRGGVKTANTNDSKVGFMDVAKLALSEEELKTLTSLINKVHSYVALANAKKEMEEAQKKYEELLKLSQGTQEEEEQEEESEEETAEEEEKVAE